MTTDPGIRMPTLEALIARAGLKATPGEIAAYFRIPVGVLRTVFDRSNSARAAAVSAGQDAATEVLAKLLRSGVRVTRRAAWEAVRADRPPALQAAAEELAILAELGAEDLALTAELVAQSDADDDALDAALAWSGIWTPPSTVYRHRRWAPPAPPPKCGAKTRRGTACIRTALHNGRCPNHGGLSTGPKTAAGRRRTIQGLKRYHAVRRAQRKRAEVMTGQADRP